LRKLLAPLLSQEPAAQLIRSTARQQWRLLAVNLGSSVVEALSEGGTLAVLLQGLQSFSRFANNVRVGTFAAECRVTVTALIHSQALRLSFPCASGTKVGDLPDDAS
jgi:subfamily B ATP-binding cassette protein MsbA